KAANADGPRWSVQRFTVHAGWHAAGECECRSHGAGLADANPRRAVDGRTAPRDRRGGSLEPHGVRRGNGIVPGDGSTHGRSVGGGEDGAIVLEAGGRGESDCRCAGGGTTGSDRQRRGAGLAAGTGGG